MKDDDYLLSYIYGNFITLTNVKKEDLDKIVKYRLEPLFISVHSIDKNIREIIFGNKRNMNGIENLKFLDKNGIKTNIQIVLCPGINDGRDMHNTLLTLINDYRNTMSIGIVPVGITKYNNSHSLKSYDKNSAREVIDDVNRFREVNKSLEGIDNIYLSDEFYVMGGVTFPSYKYYRDFNQIENGIGKSTYFLKQINDFIKNNLNSYHPSVKTVKNEKKNRILLVTSEYGEVVIRNAIDTILEKLGDYGKSVVSHLDIMEVKNKFFGGNIKITGLLSRKDIELSLKKQDINIYCKVLIPDSIFNEDNLSIDNYKRKDFKKIGKNIKIVPEDGFSFIKEIFPN